jgi:hypothetical protein
LAVAFSSAAWLFAGHADLAIQHFETSMRLNPRSQRGFHLAGIGIAYFVNHRSSADIDPLCGVTIASYSSAHLILSNAGLPPKMTRAAERFWPLRCFSDV